MRKKEYSITVILIILFITSFLILIKKNYIRIMTKEYESIAVNEYLENDNFTYEAERFNYISVLEIDKIGLKKGLVSPQNSFNDIRYNIQILDNSDMPDVRNGTLMLAAHSGNSNIGFFNNLWKLELNDEIIIYYKDKKYVYEVEDKYNVIKNGKVLINKNYEATSLVLTTCNQENKGYQLVIVCSLREILNADS